MRQIPPYPLHLGNALDARNLRQLHDLQITAVVELALEEQPRSFAAKRRDSVAVGVSPRKGRKNSRKPRRGDIGFTPSRQPMPPRWG